MPFYHESFYLSVSDYTTTNTVNPTGTIDIAAMLQQRPDFWLTRALSNKFHRKKLIINDWTMKYWDFDKRLKVRDALLECLNEGFELYIYLNDELKFIQKSDLSDNNFYAFFPVSNIILENDVDAVFEEEIFDAANIQYKFSQDSIKILDSYWIDYLINNQENREGFTHTLSLYALSRFNVDIQERIIAQLQRSNPLTLQILDDDCVGLVNPQQIQEFFPQAHIIITKLHSNCELNDYEDCDIDDHGSLRDLSTIDLTELQGISYKLDEDNKHLQGYFRGIFPSLWNLNIEMNLENTTVLLPDTMPNLAKLKFACPNIVGTGLELFLPTTNKLQQIYLCTNQGIPQYLLNIIFNLPLLETACFAISDEYCENNYEPIEISFLFDCLIRAKKLKELRLYCLKLQELDTDSYSTIIQNAYEFSALQRIFLTEMVISQDFFNRLLFIAPNITLLTLYDIHIKDSPYAHILNPLLNLEELNVSKKQLCNAQVVNNSLLDLMNNVPNLKKLTLMNINFKDLNSIKPFYKLSEAVLSYDDFDVLLCTIGWLSHTAPNLKKLVIADPGMLPKNLNLTLYSLPNVTNLTLKDSISGQILKLLLKCLPNLQVLYLRRIRNINEFADVELQQLLSKITTIRFPVAGTKSLNDSANEKIILPKLKSTKAFQQDYTPIPDDFVFTYKVINTLNQSMICQKICQYLTLKNKSTGLIPKIMNGICGVLANDCDENYMQFQDALEKIFSWDGKANSLNIDLEAHIERILSGVNTNQRPAYYIGANFKDFLEEFKTTHEHFILENCNHAIAIRYDKEASTWILYDPNCTSGIVRVAEAEIVSSIYSCIGTAIALKLDNTELPILRTPAIIEDLTTFIQHSGLFFLYRCINKQDILQQLQLKWEEEQSTIAKDVLQHGLLARGIDGVPLWATGISERNKNINEFIFILIRKFIELNSDYSQKLQQSLAVLPEFKKHALIEKLSFYQEIEEVHILIQVIRDTSINPGQFNRYFQTWRNDSAISPSLSEYAKNIFHVAKKSHLIELESSQEIDALYFALEKTARVSNTPIMKINSSNDVICSALFVARDSQNPILGTLQKGPGGLLYDFINNNRDNGGCIIINASKFSNAELIAINSLFEEDAVIDGVAVPHNIHVILLVNIKKSDFQQGADLYSRFQLVERCPVAKKELLESLPLLPEPIETTDTHITPQSSIDLFNQPFPQTVLLGAWELNEGSLIFKEGSLIAAINRGEMSFGIKNANWDEDFQCFWRQIESLGFIDYLGERFIIPEGFQLIRLADGYDWEALKNVVTITGDLSIAQDVVVLNSHTLQDFFKIYRYVDENLITLPGLIESAQNSILKVNITSNLSDDEWARLLTQCKDYNVHLTAYVSPNVTLPQQLANAGISASIPIVGEVNEHNMREQLDQNPIQVLITEDLDIAVADCMQVEHWFVLDISGLQPADLLKQINVIIQYTQNEQARFVFSERSGVLVNLLQNYTKVILKGDFSKNLLDGLAPLFMKMLSEDGEIQGKIVLITKKHDDFTYMPYRANHKFSLQRKLAILGEITPEEQSILEPVLTSEPICKLRSFLSLTRAGEDLTSIDDICKGMLQAPEGSIYPSEDVDVHTYNQNMHARVMNLLAREPYVFLSGLSGVGKTHFMNEDLAKDANVILYKGEENLTAWLESQPEDDNDTRLRILCIDEANAYEGEILKFNGLYDTPRGIVVNGKFCSVSRYHRVICNGNPIAYGNARKLSEFFVQHGNSIWINPLPLEVIRTSVLEPLFIGTDFSIEDIAKINEVFLKVYEFLCAVSTTDVLLTTRELQMMALLTISTVKKSHESDIVSLAQHFAYQLAVTHVPKEKRGEFDSKFKIEIIRDTLPILHTPKFLATPSRYTAIYQLTDFLDLRALRTEGNFGTCNDIAASNNAQLHGGLGGIILEGPPGIGKTELVMTVLFEHGYRKKNIFLPHAQEYESQRFFYHVPVNMSFKEKTQILIQAFHEGAIVVIDEINATSMPERLLNNLLMGITIDGETAYNPGFMIIGTQNPGRRSLSTPLNSRMCTIELTEYPEDEMIEILVSKGSTPQTAKALVTSYTAQCRFAHTKNLSPAPTMRSVLNLAEQVTASARVIDLVEDTAPLLVESQLEVVQNAEDSQQSHNVSQHIDEKVSIINTKSIFTENRPSLQTPILQVSRQPVFSAPSFMMISSTFLTLAIISVVGAVILISPLNFVCLAIAVAASLIAAVCIYSQYKSKNVSAAVQVPELDARVSQAMPIESSVAGAQLHPSPLI